MKKLLFSILILMGFVLFPTTVNASTATIRATASSSKINLGSTVTVTVTVTGSAPIGSWQYNLTYDTSKFTLTSTTNSTYIVDYANNNSTYKKYYTYSFKSKSLGTGYFSIKNGAVVDFASVSDMSVTTSGCSVVVANYSSNANLSALSITDAELNPVFDANTTAYNASVANTIDEITIAATAADTAATIGGIGTFAVSEGENEFTISVTAENGTTKAYIINVDVTEKNPITVKIDKKDYTIIRNGGKVETPVGYSVSTVTIDENEISSFYSEVTKLTLVLLKDEEGNLVLATYKNDTYEKYIQITSSSIVLSLSTPLASVEIPKSYIKTTTTINAEEITAWKLKNGKSTQFYLVYGTDVETGAKGFYQYDKKDQTLQRFYNEQVENLGETIHNYLLIIITLGVLILSLIGICIYLLISNKSPKIKKIKEKKLKKLKEVVDKDKPKEKTNKDDEKTKEIIKKETN